MLENKSKRFLQSVSLSRNVQCLFTEQTAKSMEGYEKRLLILLSNVCKYQHCTEEQSNHPSVCCTLCGRKNALCEFSRRLLAYRVSSGDETLSITSQHYRGKEEVNSSVQCCCARSARTLFFHIKEKHVPRRPETSSSAHATHSTLHVTLCGVRVLGGKAACVVEKVFSVKFLNFTPS